MSIVDWLRRVAFRSPARRRAGWPARRHLHVEWLEERCVLTPVVSVLPIAPQEGALFNGPVATFTDAAATPQTQYTAVINWGDGSPVQTVTPTGPTNGVFTVNGSHTYTEEKGYTITVNVTNTTLADTWTTETSMPTARWGLASALGSDGQIYVFGGDNFSGILNTVEAYNTVTNTWTTEASMPTAVDTTAAASAPNGLIYVFGGNTANNGSIATVQAYNPATNTWTTETPMPTARSDEAAALGPDGLIYVFGGVNTSGTPLTTVEAYNPATNTWATEASMPTARDGLTAALASNGLIYVIGGFNSNSGVLNTVEAYDPATNTWSTEANMPTARSDLAAAPGPDGQIYVVGGDNNNGTVFNTTEAYNPATNIWTTKTSMPTRRNYLAATLGPDGQIYAFGGQNLPGEAFALSTVEALNTNTGIGSTPITVIDQAPVVSVLPISPVEGALFNGAVATFTDPGGNEPVANYAATINWGDGSGTDTITPSVSLINGQLTVSGRHTYTEEGGYTITVTVTDDGGVSGVGTWTAKASMPTTLSAEAAAPGPNGLLYTFGGFSKGIVNTVQAYNPATNTWTTEAPLPTATDFLAAAPGPNGLIYVFGGSTPGAASINTVEAYNPATNTWTSEAPMPTARSNLAAALGPNGLIYVFGGAGKSGILNTVEAYNPATNTWTTEAPMPTAREDEAAVLAANGLIYVFGGNATFSGDGLTTVEAYNPATNTWTTEAPMPIGSLELAAAPAPNGLIYVVGGFNNTSDTLNTVQAYNPATNTWTVVASMSAARITPAAALGPNGLIYVFGGEDNNGADLATVEAYLPAGLSNANSTPIGVIDPQVQVMAAQGPFTATEGTPSAVQMLATFTDPGGPGETEYAAVINWGDGQSDTATLANGGIVDLGTVNGAESFAVKGQHTYQTSGTLTLSVSVQHAALAAITVNEVADVSGNSSLPPPPPSPPPPPPPPISSSPPPPAPAPISPDKLAVFDPTTATWTLDLGGNGTNLISVVFGLPGDRPITGDWNGAGFDEIGTVRVDPNAYAPDGNHALLWSFDTNGNNQWDGSDQSFIFGEEGDQIVLGDWNGSGTTKVGVVRPDGNGVLVWSLDYSGSYATTGQYTVYHYGLNGDQVVSGDWTGDGTDKIGVARANLNVTLADGSHPMLWALNYPGNGVYNGSFFTFGASYDALLLGDWTGDGKTKVGVAAADPNGVGADIVLDLDSNGDNNPNTANFAYGLAGDVFIRGDWNADGTDKIGVARSSSPTTLSVTLDSNRNHGFGAVFSLPGQGSDTILVGNWKP